jgi:hypothetical protein
MSTVAILTLIGPPLVSLAERCVVQQLSQLRDRFENSLLCLAKIMVRREQFPVDVVAASPASTIHNIDLEGKWRFVHEMVIDYHDKVHKQHPIETKLSVMDETYADHPEQLVVTPCTVGVCQSRSLKESIRQLDETVEELYEELCKLEECINQQQHTQQSRWALFSSSSLTELKQQEAAVTTRLLRVNGMLDDRLRRFSDAMMFWRLICASKN